MGASCSDRRGTGPDGGDEPGWEREVQRKGRVRYWRLPAGPGLQGEADSTKRKASFLFSASPVSASRTLEVAEVSGSESPPEYLSALT